MDPLHEIALNYHNSPKTSDNRPPQKYTYIKKAIIGSLLAVTTSLASGNLIRVNLPKMPRQMAVIVAAGTSVTTLGIFGAIHKR